MKDKIREELGVISELGSHWYIAKACKGMCGSMARRYVAMTLAAHVKKLCMIVNCGTIGADVFSVIDAVMRLGDELEGGGDVEDNLIVRVIDEFVEVLPIIERNLIRQSYAGEWVVDMSEKN